MPIARLQSARNRLSGGITLLAGQNRYITMRVVWADALVWVTAIAFNGVNVPLLVQNTAGSPTWSKIFGMFIPDDWIGLKTASLTTGYGNPYYVWQVFTGVNTTTPILAAVGGGSGSSSNTGVNITLAAKEGGWVIHSLGGGGGPATPIANNTLESAESEGAHGRRNNPLPNSNVTVGWTFAAGRSALAALSLNPIGFKPQTTMISL